MAATAIAQQAARTGFIASHRHVFMVSSFGDSGGSTGLLARKTVPWRRIRTSSGQHNPETSRFPSASGPAEQVDGTRPRLMAVLERDAHVYRRIAARRNVDLPFELEMTVRVRIGQAKDTDPASQAAGLEDDVVEADRVDRQRGLEVRRVDIERPA